MATQFSPAGRAVGKTKIDLVASGVDRDEVDGGPRLDAVATDLEGVAWEGSPRRDAKTRVSLIAGEVDPPGWVTYACALVLQVAAWATPGATTPLAMAATVASAKSATVLLTLCGERIGSTTDLLVEPVRAGSGSNGDADVIGYSRLGADRIGRLGNFVDQAADKLRWVLGRQVLER